MLLVGNQLKERSSHGRKRIVISFSYGPVESLMKIAFYQIIAFLQVGFRRVSLNYNGQNIQFWRLDYILSVDLAIHFELYIIVLNSDLFSYLKLAAKYLHLLESLQLAMQLDEAVF